MEDEFANSVASTFLPTLTLELAHSKAASHSKRNQATMV
jgi:hypothetical protein